MSEVKKETKKTKKKRRTPRTVSVSMKGSGGERTIIVRIGGHAETLQIPFRISRTQFGDEALLSAHVKVPVGATVTEDNWVALGSLQILS